MLVRDYRPMAGMLAIALALSVGAGTAMAQSSKTGPKTMPAEMPMQASAMMKPTMEMVTTMTAGWPQASRMAAKEMMDKYGAPQEATATHLMWHKNGPWLWTRIDNYENNHEFPAHHTDVMEQAINYRVQPAMFDDLAAFDGSVYVRRTEGVISARCDKEGNNLLALNLANYVATGKRTVLAARMYYGKAITAFKKSNIMDPYMQGLKFQPMTSMTSDADVPQS